MDMAAALVSDSVKLRLHHRGQMKINKMRGLEAFHGNEHMWLKRELLVNKGARRGEHWVGQRGGGGGEGRALGRTRQGREEHWVREQGEHWVGKWGKGRALGRSNGSGEHWVGGHGKGRALATRFGWGQHCVGVQGRALDRTGGALGRTARESTGQDGRERGSTGYRCKNMRRGERPDTNTERGVMIIIGQDTVVWVRASHTTR